MSNPTEPSELIDLSMNESPYAPLPSVQAVVERAVPQLHRYPPHTAAGLVSALAQRLDVAADEILVGPGSAGLCQNLIQSLGPQRRQVVYPELSFEAYPLMVFNTGSQPVPVPLTGYAHDLDAMAAAVTEDTRCVLVCNPNNPTSDVLSTERLAAFLDRIPSEVLVIIDEAYREYVTDPDAADGLALRRGRDNVCVLRTFSKAYGLATLRVGYALAPAAVAQRARMTGLVFYPGGLGQVAATASLVPEVDKELLTRCAENAEARAELAERLRALGLPVAPSQTNFLWVPNGAEAEVFAARCRAAGILVRPYPGLGVRITIGSAEATERLLAVASAG